MSPKNITLLELLMGFFFSTNQLYYSYNILQLLDTITTTTILKKTHLQQHLIKRQQLSHQLHYKNTRYILTLQNIIKNCCTSSYYYNYHYNN